MNHSCTIRSTENVRYKDWKKLLRQKGSIAPAWRVEGIRLVEEALKACKSGQEPQAFQINPAMNVTFRARRALVDEQRLRASERLQVLVKQLEEQAIPIDRMTPALFDQCASTVHSQGILLAVCPEGQDIDRLALFLTHAKRVLILERIQDPGNLGAIIRSADAMGYDGIILVGQGTSPSNPKALRAGMGAFFHLPVFELKTSEAAFDALARAAFRSVAGALGGRLLTPDLSNTLVKEPRLAIWIGNEGEGLLKTTQDRADTVVTLEMNPRAESYNAACAATLLCYLLRKS